MKKSDLINNDTQTVLDKAEKMRNGFILAIFVLVVLLQ